jgi:CO/xanthine dehydrogenase Mo-binding subunit
MGGIGYGIGMAMSEETLYDSRNGRPVRELPMTPDRVMG